MSFKAVAENGLGLVLAFFLLRMFLRMFVNSVNQTEARYNELWKAQQESQRATLEALMNCTRALQETVALHSRYLSRLALTSHDTPDSGS